MYNYNRIWILLYHFLWNIQDTKPLVLHYISGFLLTNDSGTFRNSQHMDMIQNRKELSPTG